MVVGLSALKNEDIQREAKLFRSGNAYKVDIHDTDIAELKQSDAETVVPYTIPSIYTQRRYCSSSSRLEFMVHAWTANKDTNWEHVPWNFISSLSI